MKTHLISWYKKLLKQGKYKLANRILYCLINKSKSIRIADVDHEAWESGFADWLMEKCFWSNGKYSFTAVFTYE